MKLLEHRNILLKTQTKEDLYFKAVPIKTHGQVSNSELESIRQGLMLALGSRDEINRLFPIMDYSYLIYHLTVLRLERLRKGLKIIYLMTILSTKLLVYHQLF